MANFEQAQEIVDLGSAAKQKDGQKSWLDKHYSFIDPPVPIPTEQGSIVLIRTVPLKVGDEKHTSRYLISKSKDGTFYANRFDEEKIQELFARAGTEVPKAPPGLPEVETGRGGAWIGTAALVVLIGVTITVWLRGKVRHRV